MRLDEVADEVGDGAVLLDFEVVLGEEAVEVRGDLFGLRLRARPDVHHGEVVHVVGRAREVPLELRVAHLDLQLVVVRVE